MIQGFRDKATALVFAGSLPRGMARDLAVAAHQVISCSRLDAGQVDFSDIDAGERLPPVHPGEMPREDFLRPPGVTAHALALAPRVPANRVTAILSGRRAVTADTAPRLARHFSTGAGFWIKLRKAYELEIAERNAGARIRAEVAPRNAA
jgi:addiction module HigA family antidote